MSLRVWLPLNGDLHNQGISLLPSLSFNNFTTSSNGKIGNCYKGWGIYHLNEEILDNCWSVSAWVKADSWYSANNIIICKNAAAGDVYQIYFSIVGTNQIKLGINNASGIIYNNYTFTTGQWHHVVGTYDGKVGTIYINGELKISQTVANTFVSGMNNLSLGCRGSNAAGTTAWVGNNGTDIRYLNDVRIYDHCLSAAEVKEIAQGLVLHYKLDNNGQGGRNLAPHSSNFSGWSVGTGWTKLEENGSTAYHYERTGATANAWNRLIPNLHIIPDEHPNGITVSLDFKCDDISALNQKTIGALQIYRDDNVRVGWYESQWNLNNCVSGQWQRISRTYTQAQLKTNNSSSYPNATIAYTTVSFQLVQNGSIYIKHIKIEDGNTATAYSLAPEDYGNDGNIIEDSSGYNHNGTIVGSAIPATDTARYNVSTHIDGAGVITATSPGADIRTLSCWVKTTKNKSTSQMLVADSASNMCISFYNGTIIGVFGATRSTGSKCTLGTSYKENDWNHIVVVKTSDDGQRDIYCNGEKLAPAANDYWGAVAGFYVGNRNGTGSGNTPFFGYISDVRAYCTPLLDTDIKWLYNVSMKVDKFGNIHPFELEENISVVSNAKFINNSANSVTYDTATDTYTIVSKADTSSWGYGVRLADDPPLWIPYGATYRWTAEVWTPIALNVNTDYNNTTGNADTNWAGNDNDATGTRLTANVAIPANKWTRIYRGASNTNNGNTNHLPIRDYSSLGLVTNGQSNPVTWKVRHLQWYIADTEFKPQIKRTGIFKASHFTETEEDLDKPAQFNKKMLSVNATQFIEH